MLTTNIIEYFNVKIFFFMFRHDLDCRVQITSGDMVMLKIFVFACFQNSENDMLDHWADDFQTSA